MQTIRIYYRVIGGRDTLTRSITERELRHKHPDIETTMLDHDDSPAAALSEVLREMVDVDSWASDWDSNSAGHYIVARWTTLNEAAADLLS